MIYMLVKVINLREKKNFKIKKLTFFKWFFLKKSEWNDIGKKQQSQSSNEYLSVFFLFYSWNDYATLKRFAPT